MFEIPELTKPNFGNFVANHQNIERRQIIQGIQVPETPRR